jgi:hypothetical protein
MCGSQYVLPVYNALYSIPYNYKRAKDKKNNHVNTMFTGVLPKVKAPTPFN